MARGKLPYRGEYVVCGFVLIALLVLAVPVSATDWPVTTGSDINAVISSASSEDTITLAPGTYNWHAITVSKSLTFRADTAHGHGPSDTIIDAQFADRIFSVSGTYRLTIDNLTLRNGLIMSGFGGAIYTESSTIEVNSSIITNCQAGVGESGGNGGAIYTQSGSVKVTSSTISNCRATSRDTAMLSYGGAIYAPSGSVTVTDSTIANCAAGISHSDHSFGGAIYGRSVTVTSSTITSNQAGNLHLNDYTSSYGGAINVNYAGGSTVRFSRLTDNHAIRGGDKLGVDTLYGPITASNNWWGSNAGPSASDCGNGASAGTWLKLGIVASPASIPVSGISTVSANLTYNSAGTDTSGSGTVQNGILVHFTATGGTVSPEYVGTKNGVATTIFTPSGTGTATINATVDRESVRVPVTITADPVTTNVTSIVIDPVTASKIYAGVENQGVYRSTDSGSSWTAATTQPGNLHIRALAINRQSPSTLYAGTYGGGVYLSTDSGATWSACTGLPNLNILSLAGNSTGSVFAGTENGVFTSTDDCTSWTALNSGLP